MPFTALSAQALRGLAESVVLREGTDYGERERSFEAKVEELLARVRSGEARIVFDLRSQSADIVPSEPPSGPAA
ncbi:MAG TPA: YheU family protein [Steroidobacteraceae bacterium]|nr:YheU family protein [Steroidobacteraceae bacterium]